MTLRSDHPREYASWKMLRQRCCNRTFPRYADWGGRGVAVDPRWEDFETFLRDMGARPEGTSLDRIDNRLGYGPENCRWATAAEQQRNTRRTIWVTLNGERRVLKDWAAQLDVNYVTVCMRIKRGMTPADALTTPVVKRSR